MSPSPSLDCDFPKHGWGCQAHECSGTHVLLPTVPVLFFRLRNVVPESPEKRHRVVALSPGWSGPIRTKAPAALILVAYGLPSHPPSPIAETRICLDHCLCRVPSGVPGSAIGCWAAEWCRCRDSRKSLNHTTSVEYLAPLPTWETYRPVPELER